MRSYSISQLAKIFGLSRSTLLYYDRIGLLRAAERSESGYRRYSQQEHDRLERICTYRSTGLSLAEIREVLSAESEPGTEVLEKRLQELGDEILALKVQQQLVAAMLKNIRGDKAAPPMDKQAWVAMLEAAGMDETAMRRWHADFEARSPQTHHDFLMSLGISEDEARDIQSWSRTIKPRSRRPAQFARTWALT